MEKNQNIIKDVNIEGKNNDMIDKLESLFNDINFGDVVRNAVKIEINKLRNELKNKEINWTQNEQEEIKKLLSYIFLNESNDFKKIELIINILNKKINNELKEIKENDLIKPKILINEIKKNNIIKKNGIISDVYIGDSKYLLLLFPVEHVDILQKKYQDINDETLKKLVDQNFKLNIINELIKCGYSKTIAFEGLDFNEISLGFNDVLNELVINFFNEYLSLLKKPKENFQKIKKMQQIIVYFSMNNLYPEYLNGDDLLSYGIEDFTSKKISDDIFEFIQILSEKNSEKKSISDLIEDFILKKEKKYGKEYGSQFDINIYIKSLKNKLLNENINKASKDDYIILLFKKYFEFLHNMRNKDVVSNVELLYNNSTPNGIMLKFGNSHFGNPDILLESFRKEGLFSDLKIKDIKTILKEKGISYIEITPKK